MVARRIPKYALHKASGQARVIIAGVHFYLGEFNSAKSHQKYAQLIAAHFSPGGTVDAATRNPSSPLFDLSIDELLVKYIDFAQTYYVKDGEPTKELTCMKDAMGHLRGMYGSELASEFGPKKLKAVREHMIAVHDLSRGVINNRINRIKRIFKWAVGEQLVQPNIYYGLQAVTGLKFGRTTAREMEPVRPVDDEHVDAILPNVTPQVAAMIQIQRLAGMRPEEVTRMRVCDIDSSAEIWVYCPPDHKKRWLGHQRKIAFGPQAQKILTPFLNRKSKSFLFSPIEAEDFRHQQQRTHRESPVTPSQQNRKPKAAPKRAKRDHYDTASYRRAIKYGINKTNRLRQKADPKAVLVPHWFPYQLRHTHGTAVRNKFGYEAAAVSLGHARTDVTEIYAESDFNRAIEVARQIG